MRRGVTHMGVTYYEGGTVHTTAFVVSPSPPKKYALAPTSIPPQKRKKAQKLMNKKAEEGRGRGGGYSRHY